LKVILNTDTHSGGPIALPGPLNWLISIDVVLDALRKAIVCRCSVVISQRCLDKQFHWLSMLWSVSFVRGGRWRGRSGTVGGRSPGCFFWLLPKKCIPKPDQHRKAVIQQSH